MNLSSPKNPENFQKISKQNSRQILVTYALPYANGPLHLGHMLGFIQTDIWVRFLRMNGHECYFICGGDTHGTPIMLKAKERHQDPADMVQEIMALQKSDLNSFGISLDNFYSTHSPENQKLSGDIYQTLQKKGDILAREIEQAFDDEAQMFLPDRFIKGTCPRCKASDQYGDSCEKCGATYDPKEVINPISQISGKAPSFKKSIHYFFQLGHYETFLKQWMADAHLQESLKNKLQEWFEAGLKDWDISRDSPYFGFEIPGAPGKYFYVWLDAPIGYLASFKNYCDQHPNINFDHYFKSDSPTELYHFIGKDIAYFHTLFWPAVLKSADYRLPTGVPVHGFVTINGEKMSKSRGTFITALDFLEKTNPETLRYYYAAKLNDSLEDIDLNLEDFTLRCNSDLVGKFVNIASRTAGFLNKLFDGQLSDQLINPGLFNTLAEASTEISEAYETRNTSKAMRIIMGLADQVNQFIEQQAPWSLAKDPEKKYLVQAVCTQALNNFYQLCVYLKPVLPELVKKAELFLNAGELRFVDAQKPLLAHKISVFTPLLTRIDPEQIKTLVNQNQ